MPWPADLVRSQTADLISEVKARLGEAVRTEGRRAVLFHVDEPIDPEVVREVTALALTYKLRREAKRGPRAKANPTP